MGRVRKVCMKVGLKNLNARLDLSGLASSRSDTLPRNLVLE